MFSVQDSVIHAHGMLRYFRKAWKYTSRRRVYFYAIRKSSNIPSAWIMLSCTRENHLVIWCFIKLTTVKRRLIWLKILMKCSILTTIVINQSGNRYSTLLKTTTNVNIIWLQIRENIQRNYRDFFDKIYEIWNGKPTKQRAKVVLKILDLNTWRLRSVGTLKREMLYLPWSDEFQRHALLLAEQGPVVRRPDSAVHRIVIFSSFVKSVVDWYNSY
jgi:hypothetical protein